MTSGDGQEVQANLDRAADSLGAAKTLIEAEYYDDATSRAYYAVFYAATAALVAEGERFKKHSGVINGINRHFVKTGRLSADLGRDLNWLFGLRLVGDYGETRHVAEEEAKKAVRTAEGLVATLKKLAT